MIHRVGLVFSGGPAPAANAVIAAAANSFLADGIDVIGFFHGYTALERYDAQQRPLILNEDYRFITEQDTHGMRTSRGVFIGTARAHPGNTVDCAADLGDPSKTAKLERVRRALVDLNVDALVSIGGDGTLRAAALLHAYQARLPASETRVRVVHVPKTIDNDYAGIDFTFGFFTAVDVLSRELLNLKADAIATSAYYIVETMGRRAGWIAYGAAIAGEANLVIGVEDVGKALDLDSLVSRITDLIIAREDKRQQHYGTIVLAEGLAERLSPGALGGAKLAKHVAELVAQAYKDRTGKKKKVVGLEFGYEARGAEPHAFDVILGSQLGVGAYRALVEQDLDGQMISVEGQLALRYVAFEQLVDPDTFFAKTRFIDTHGDFFKLAHFLERRADRADAPKRARTEEEGT